MKRLAVERIERTPIDNLVANLRGEVGDVICTWTLLEDLLAARRANESGDLLRDMEDHPLTAMSAICEKLADDIVVRLSELAQRKVGRLNFYFVSLKLPGLSTMVNAFSYFISRNQFTEKRNYDISHRELPEQWSDHKFIVIPFPTICRGVALAMLMMKKIDRVYLGPSSPYLWRKMRSKRRDIMMPLRSNYLLLPYIQLSQKERLCIIQEEAREGQVPWVPMRTTLNGKPAIVPVNKKWGAVRLGERVILLDAYPLNELQSLEVH